MGWSRAEGLRKACVSEGPQHFTANYSRIEGGVDLSAAQPCSRGFLLINVHCSGGISDDCRLLRRHILGPRRQDVVTLNAWSLLYPEGDIDCRDT